MRFIYVQQITTILYHHGIQAKIAHGQRKRAGYRARQIDSSTIAISFDEGLGALYEKTDLLLRANGFEVSQEGENTLIVRDSRTDQTISSEQEPGRGDDLTN